MTAEIHRVCVFAGSSPGARAEYRQAAVALARTLAERGLGLVYGGARVGLMGVVADAALEAGVEVVGVIPRVLAVKEIAHDGLTQLHVVASMHERKAAMADLADAFVALPGGLGTLDELAEILTWGQLGLHSKPVGVLNVAGYFDKLLDFLDSAVAERFVPPEHRATILTDAEAPALLDRFAQYVAPALPKWIDRETS
jgi:uncharacterized protein (TIGR00730 family)